MTIPAEYRLASVEFEKFMVDARDLSGLVTTNMAYNMVVGVLHVFRRCLSVQEALRFAGVLPAVLRAIFVSDWDTEQPRLAFGDLASMTKEVQQLRKAHNFSPDTVIHDVALALRRLADPQELERVLSSFSPDGQAYWRV